MSVFGLVVFAAFLGGILHRQAIRWRYLAESYGANAGPVLAKRRMRSAVLIGKGAYNVVMGIVTIGIHRNGVSFRAMPILGLFHDPLFVPYSDIRGWKTTWYLNARSSELEFRRAPEVKMVLPADDAEWIQSHAGDAMMLSDDRPPQGNAGRGWHAFAVSYTLYALVMVVGVVTYLLIRWLGLHT